MNKDHLITMLAWEGFIRRAAMLDEPFMLKGSFVTRQYMQKPEDRYALDLDWLYMRHVREPEQSRDIFDGWMMQVTGIDLGDGIRFRSFAENAFWRRIDYAMDDDFPTINTDLHCWVNGVEVSYMQLDISFNLGIGEREAVPLEYIPLEWDAFWLPYTCPLYLQVAWKLHQCLVRARAKDMFDLIRLLQHPGFDANALTLTLQALVDECHKDGVDVTWLGWLVNGQAAWYCACKEQAHTDSKAFAQVHRVIPQVLIPEDKPYWDYITPNAALIPTSTSALLYDLHGALLGAGITLERLNALPDPSKRK